MGVCAVDFYAHGDSIHITDLVPSRPGLEMFQITEATGVPGYFVRGVFTCEVLGEDPNSTEEGPGRGVAADIDPDNPGRRSGAAASVSSAPRAARTSAARQLPPISCPGGMATRVGRS